MINEFLGIGIFSGILCIAILLINKNSFPLANKLLVGVILPLTIIQVMFSLYETGYIQKVPWLYRWNTPLNMLIFPCAYLYVHAILRDKNELKRTDYLHFLPAILHLSQMLPFYLLPLSTKKAIVSEILAHGEKVIKFEEGGLPPYVQYFVLIFQGFIYSFFMYRMILSFQSKGSDRKFNTGKQWLWVFTTLVSVFNIALLVNIIFPPPPGIVRINWLIVSIMFTILMITNYLFFQPNVLYGIPRIRESKLPDQVTLNSENIPAVLATHTKNDEPDINEGKLNSELSSEEEAALQKEPDKEFSHLIPYAPLIETYFQNKKPFLKSGYNIADLSAETGIPVHHLSAFLNKVYRIRFNDFVNAKRLEYLDAAMQNEEYRNYTQEKIALNAGFSSRISFFNALKKLRGQTPHEFLTSIKQKKQV